MSALLYYSTSAGLTADERIEIDKEIVKNRKKVCIFVKNVASNAKGKTEKVIVVVTLAGVVWFSNLESAEAIGCSMVLRPTPVVTVQPNSKHRYEMKFG